jgi:hypothetical protein
MEDAWRYWAIGPREPPCQRRLASVAGGPEAGVQFVMNAPMARHPLVEGVVGKEGKKMPWGTAAPSTYLLPVPKAVSKE